MNSVLASLKSVLAEGTLAWQKIVSILSENGVRLEAYQYALIGAGTVTIWFLIRSTFRKSALPEFDGPRGLPLLGNIHQLGEKQWLKYTEWHETFGPIYKLNFAGTKVLVIGSAKIAADLTERRSAIYSDRPRFIMASEILTGGMNLAFAPYSDRWKRMRQAANHGLSVRASEDYIQLQAAEATSLMYHLLDSKKDIDTQCRRTGASTILSAVYAYPPISFEDKLVHRVENYVDRLLKAALPGNFLVDVIPAMKRLPLWMARWKREGYAWYKKDTDMWLKLVDDVRTGVKAGERTDCLVAKLINPEKPQNIDQVEMAWLAGMMFGAGAEAIAATLSFFILAMVLYPDVQTKLRDEIDTAVGHGQLPRFHDIRNLPYLGAVIKEVLRWRPMGPLGVPHRSVEDDVYMNHFIPAGTLIFTNIWAMHMDKSVYKNPEQFLPERYLAADGVTPVQYQDTKELGHHSFGFGRRSCIGWPVAVNALLINAASIVYAFKISKAKDAMGNEITPDADDLLDEGLAVRPTPFDCTLQSRSTEIRELIHKKYETVQKTGHA
ncbi:cytochrome P450 [Mycena epipterygia]|nr:cytochrome P450 [Mycena epipterygia]